MTKRRGIKAPSQPARFRRLQVERLEVRRLLCASGVDSDHLLSGVADLSSRTLLASSVGSHQLQTEPGFNQLVVHGDVAAATSPSGLAAATYALSSVPVLNSLAGAAATIYLDFIGHFDASWGTYSNITTPVFDQDGDATTFSDADLTSITNIWQAVSEDFAPFKINVSTVAPPNFNNGAAQLVAIGGSGAWTGGTYGGVSYTGSFTNSSPNTSFVFSDNLSNGYWKYVGDAVSHEVGHSLGLQHQSQYSDTGAKLAEYYAGPGDGTAPIMGHG